MNLIQTQDLLYMIGVISIVLVIMVIILMVTITKLNKRLRDETNKGRKLLSQKKSSEVRLGKIGENMAPFIEDWPYDHNKFRFLGNPIDGIQFTDYEIIFVEIKTGKSRLTTTQKQIKKLVAEGKVSFATFRIGEHGCTLKKDEMNHCNLCGENDGDQGC
jgi:predicted Holliday junction resolvase-like endonuclease